MDCQNEQELILPDHLLTTAEIRRKYAHSYEELKKKKRKQILLKEDQKPKAIVHAL